ncbi:hypothetical protein [Pseudomonas lurida]|uniref:hypothetical protein n=1 Tax=Pseudomonas lurida TaxID=244566 RepID=UPI001F20C9AA|nr:hypothetical protein [Pseudomonas lurida]MCF5024701.1 hypothetical protein [Pseudomonas lurida]MCF5307458.1 hypothetical protein [Pseudomonas lurida]MCF5324517.1 hypothetical protein [Pseudomonas lurida]
MDWLQFVSSVIGSVAWPTAVITIIALLREPVGKLLPLIRTLKYKDLQIDVGQELEAVKESVEAITDQPERKEKPTPAFRQLAKIDPRAAVLSAWVPIELALRDLGTRHDVYKLGMPIYLLAEELSKAGILNGATFQALRGLMRIRNEAMHFAPISYDEAISMGELCEWALERLKAQGAQV